MAEAPRVPETVTPAVPTVAPSVQAPTKPQAIVPPAALGRVRAPPAERRFASAHGIDLSAIVGSGPFGAIVLDDVDRATGTAVTPHIERKRAAGLDLNAMRAAIAAAMARSKRYLKAKLADQS